MGTSSSAFNDEDEDLIKPERVKIGLNAVLVQTSARRTRSNKTDVIFAAFVLRML